MNNYQLCKFLYRVSSDIHATIGELDNIQQAHILHLLNEASDDILNSIRILEKTDETNSY